MTVTISPSIRKDAAKVAFEEGISLSFLIESLLKGKVEARKKLIQTK